MKKRSIWYVLIKALIFLGVYTLFHYAYPILPWPIFGVSESVWEHLKMGFFAATFLIIVESIGLWVKAVVFSWTRFLISRITGVMLVPLFLFLLFYLSVAVCGQITPLLLKVIYVVTITFITGLLVAYIENEMLDYPWENQPLLLFLLLVFFFIAAYLFFAFTYYQPYYPLFVER